MNGEVRQHASTCDLLFGLADIVAHVSRFYHLLPGDVIMTGTPEGVAPVRPGDVMTAETAQANLAEWKAPRAIIVSAPARPPDPCLRRAGRRFTSVAKPPSGGCPNIRRCA